MEGGSIGGWMGADGPGQHHQQHHFDDVLYVEDEPPHEIEELSGSELGEDDHFAAAALQHDDDDDDDDDESEGYSAHEPERAYGIGEEEDDDEWLDGGSEGGWVEEEAGDEEGLEEYGVEFSQMGLMSPTAAATCDVTSSSFDVTPGRQRRTSLLRVGKPTNTL